jgi:hypothetical protein
VALRGWNDNQIDPLSEAEFDTTVASASRSAYSYGCEGRAAPYCEAEHCPVWLSQNKENRR